MSATMPLGEVLKIMATAAPEQRMALAATLPQDSRGPQILITGIGLAVLMVIVVSLRMYTRAVILRSVGPDDWFILGSTCFGIVLAIFNSYSVKYGSGEHIWNVDRSPSNMKNMFRSIYFCTVAYAFVVALMKLSIAFQIRRITVPNTKSRKAINIILVLSVITGVFLVGIQTFQCIPVQNAWKLVPPGQPKPGCSSVRISGYTPNIINIVMDFIIWIVPLPLLAKLKLPKLQKIILMMVFSVGAVVCGASIGRIIVLKRAIEDKEIQMDSTYYLSFVFIWSMIEGYVAVIFASVPPLRQLVRLIFPSVLNTTHTYPNGNIGSFYNNQSSRKNQATGTDIEIGSIHPNLSANTSEEGLAPKVLKESSHQPR